MKKYLFICIFFLAFNLSSNEVTFVDVKELNDSSIEVSYKIAKGKLINKIKNNLTHIKKINEKK